MMVTIIVRWHKNGCIYSLLTPCLLLIISS